MPNDGMGLRGSSFLSTSTLSSVVGDPYGILQGRPVGALVQVVEPM